MKKETSIQEVINELDRAIKNWPPMNSAHEGMSILREEVDELWDIVKKKPRERSIRDMRAEATQVAAMALRFVIDCASEDGVSYGK